MTRARATWGRRARKRFKYVCAGERAMLSDDRDDNDHDNDSEGERDAERRRRRQQPRDEHESDTHYYEGDAQQNF